MGIIGQLISKFSKGPAIQNLENFDMVVEMKDGGILLPIACSKHLDESNEILDLLRTKVANYVAMTDLDEFKKDFPKREYFQIELNCIRKPDKRIIDELGLFEKQYANKSIRFTWRS
jgi:hypothetical protein